MMWKSISFENMCINHTVSYTIWRFYVCFPFGHQKSEWRFGMKTQFHWYRTKNNGVLKSLKLTLFLWKKIPFITEVGPCSAHQWILRINPDYRIVASHLVCHMTTWLCTVGEKWESMDFSWLKLFILTAVCDVCYMLFLTENT